MRFFCSIFVYFLQMEVKFDIFITDATRKTKNLAIRLKLCYLYVVVYNALFNHFFFFSQFTELEKLAET